MSDDLFKGVGVEIGLPNGEGFLKIKETLTRMGIASKDSKRLIQSCHILHKQGRYAIVHFKEMFTLDGKENNFTDQDRGRRDTIVKLLEEWGLVNVLDDVEDYSNTQGSFVKVIPHKEKSEWELISKYNVGKKGR